MQSKNKSKQSVSLSFLKKMNGTLKSQFFTLPLFLFTSKHVEGGTKHPF